MPRLDAAKPAEWVACTIVVVLLGGTFGIGSGGARKC